MSYYYIFTAVVIPSCVSSSSLLLTVPGSLLDQFLDVNPNEFVNLLALPRSEAPTFAVVQNDIECRGGSSPADDVFVRIAG